MGFQACWFFKAIAFPVNTSQQARDQGSSCCSSRMHSSNLFQLPVLLTLGLLLLLDAQLLLVELFEVPGDQPLVHPICSRVYTKCMKAGTNCGGRNTTRRPLYSSGCITGPTSSCCSAPRQKLLYSCLDRPLLQLWSKGWVAARFSSKTGSNLSRQHNMHRELAHTAFRRT